MRKIILRLLPLCLMISCIKDRVTTHYTFYKPVYQTKAETRAGISSAGPTIIEAPGKIVVKDGFVFLNEVDKGIHVIDITDPAKPLNTGFISIPGCIDLAINGTHLYADCYTDLVTIDISNPAQAALKQFLPGVFPHRVYYSFSPDTSKVILQWERRDTAITTRFDKSFAEIASDINRQYNGGVFFSMSAGNSEKVSPVGTGVAGSMARFALMNNRMYTVSWSDLKVFNINQPSAPQYVKALQMTQGNIETIFPYRNNLFIGSQAGMFIYDAVNPDQPQKIGQFNHVRSCDPVIADGNYAYVTLRGGTSCGGFTNQLDIVFIGNLTNPGLVKSYPLTAPEGLTKDGNILLICDGKEGLKVFDAADANKVKLLKQVTGFEPKDVIALGGIAIATATDGLYCVDYTDAANTKIISKIPVVKN